jgi:cytochrome P450
VPTEPAVLGSDFYQSPLSCFDRLRAGGPVHHVVLPTGLRAWLVTDYAHAKELLTDGRLSKSRQARARLLAERSGHRPVAQDNAAISSHMLAADPPDHGRLRALVNRGFTARRVAGLRGRVEEITAELLDAIPADVEVDLLDSLAFPLTMAVIGELLGVPAGERAQFRGVVHALFAAGREQAEYEQNVAALLDYLRQLIARARAEPDGTLVSALIEARDGLDRLSEDELSSVAGLLLTAGYETTANLIGSGVLTLLGNPDQLAALRADPDLIPAAVEELLRFCAPVYLATPRFTLEPVRCGPVTIPAHEIVFVSLLAANHDAGHFPSPGTFDIARPGDGHLAFGHGIHFCLGAPLARLETEVALRGLLARFEDITLSVAPDSLRWRPSTVVHGLERLPIRVRRST